MPPLHFIYILNGYYCLYSFFRLPDTTGVAMITMDTAHSQKPYEIVYPALGDPALAHKAAALVGGNVHIISGASTTARGACL